MVRWDKALSKTGLELVDMQLAVSSIDDYESINPSGRFMDNLNTAMETSHRVDLPALQVLVRNALEDGPGNQEAILHLQLPHEAVLDGGQPKSLAEGHIAVCTDGNVLCMLMLDNLPISYDGPQRVKSSTTVAWIWLRGRPSQHLDGQFNALDQMKIVQGILTSKITANVDRHPSRNVQDSADEIADVVHQAKSDLAEHILVDDIWVDVKLHRQDDDDTTGSSKSDQPEADLDHDQTDGMDGLDRDTHVHMAPTRNFECEHASAIKELLRELDSKLLSIKATSSEVTAVSDKATHSVQLAANEQPGSKMQRGVVVALGSNIGNRIEEIEKACRAIDADPDMRIVDTSFLYETKPMYVEDQGHFVNGACEASEQTRTTCDIVLRY